MEPREVLMKVDADCRAITELLGSGGAVSERVATLTKFITGLPDVRLQAAAIQLSLPSLPFHDCRLLISEVYMNATKSITFDLETTDLALPTSALHLSRPYHTAVMDLWALQRIYVLIQGLYFAHPRMDGAAEVSPFVADLEEVWHAINTAMKRAEVADSAPTPEVGQEWTSSDYAVVASTFEQRFIKGCAWVCLKKGVDSATLVRVGQVLFSVGVDGIGKEWREALFGCFRVYDLCILFVAAVEDSFLGNSSCGDGLFDFVYGMIDTVVRCKEGREGVEFLVGYCWDSGNLPAAYLMAHVLQCTCSNHNVVIELEPLLLKLKDCWFLWQQFPSSILDRVTARNLNATERTSVPRLIALYQTMVAPKVPPTQTAETLSKIYSHFGPSISDAVPMYTSRLHADAWLADPCAHVEDLLHCVGEVKRIRHPVLRNAVVVFMYHHWVNVKLRTLVDMIDKARKAPRDGACLHNLGGMDVTAVLVFLEQVGLLLAEDCLVVEDGLMGCREIWVDVVEALRVFSGVLDVEQYADDVFGAILSRLKVVGEDMELSRDAVKEHLILVKVLKAIFVNDVKMVRPSRLFSHQLMVGQTLWQRVGGQDPGMTEDEFAEVVGERAQFQAKLPDKDIAKIIFL
ncbi:hypothetical protein BC830DRAFT_1139068 [Chytriomyces sp. MP71]|nr:hypothetical protein BC830DRAFT_1139068 [Chytriomyces sp. MP71]